MTLNAKRKIPSIQPVDEPDLKGAEVTRYAKKNPHFEPRDSRR